MTSSPSDTDTTEEGDVDVEEAAPHPLAEYAERVADVVGGDTVITFDTIKVTVPADRWVEVLTLARDELDLVSFSFLSAIDWSNDVQVGNPLEEELEEESFEILATLGDLSEGRRVTFSTTIPHVDPIIDSVVEVFWGANWHERETHEMFGIDFRGHPDLSKLYLPEHFVGYPLLKSFPLLSREVKPWPGKVDVEDMPEPEEAEGEEGPEASDEDTGDESGGDGEAVPDEGDTGGEEES